MFGLMSDHPEAQTMSVFPVPCLQDNYAYLIICQESRETAVVDPSEAGPILHALEEHGLGLTAILNTHHHFDHVGGNVELLRRYPDLRVYGHKSDRGRIPLQTEFLDESDPVAIGRLKGRITHNPGHTTGAISYYFEDAVFTGDTLFSAGCGRMFEGDAATMFASLRKIASVSGETRVFFGHEYTEKNLEFARTVEEDNAAVEKRLEHVRELRRNGAFTTPSTVAVERETNPFLRCESEQLRDTVRRRETDNDLSPVSVFRALRDWKDQF